MFRFTIRDLLWLTVVVALGVLWWGEYRQRMSDSAELRADYRRLEKENRLLSQRPAFSESQLQAIMALLEKRRALEETETPSRAP